MSDITTNNVAAVNGAFEVSIFNQRLASLCNTRPTVPSFRVECKFHYLRGNPAERDMFPISLFTKQMELGVKIGGIQQPAEDSEHRRISGTRDCISANTY